VRQTPPRSVGSHRQIPLRLKKDMPRFLPRADSPSCVRKRRCQIELAPRRATQSPVNEHPELDGGKNVSPIRAAVLHQA
jgi:hypothetical protein